MTALLFRRYPVDERRIAEFESRAVALLTAMRSSPGVLWAEASRVLGDETAWLLVSEWRTAGDADAFAEAVAAFDVEVDPLLRGEVSTRTFSSP